MSISNVKSATQVQGSRQANNTEKTSSSADVKGAKGAASSARESLATNSDRELGSLLGTDFNKQAGFAAIQGVLSGLNPSRDTQLLKALGEKAKLTTAA